MPKSIAILEEEEEIPVNVEYEIEDEVLCLYEENPSMAVAAAESINNFRSSSHQEMVVSNFSFCVC